MPSIMPPVIEETYPPYRRGFVMMPFGTKDRQAADRNLKTKRSNSFLPGPRSENQTDLFHLLLFAVNDAYFQNYTNRSTGEWKPIKLERADLGAGRSPDLLGNLMKRIDASDLCLADYTFPNLNVSLEVGYALAKDKYLVPLFRQGLDLFDYEAPSEDVMFPQITDLFGRLFYSISIKPILESDLWKNIRERIVQSDVATNIVNVVTELKNEVTPFDAPLTEGHHRTFLGAWIKKNGFDDKMESSLRRLEDIYVEGLVRVIYPSIRPMNDKWMSWGMEEEYCCTAYSSRAASDLAHVFEGAKEKILILTTNLQGLVGYIDAIKTAVERSVNSRDFRVHILTLNPESEFVNYRGKLIGKDITDFRKEMKTNLRTFQKELLEGKTGHDPRIAIRLYNMFPTQITYFIDDYVFSSVVSVNHQSRDNIVFKIDKKRRGVSSSFIQHWDSIWALAEDIRQFAIS